MSNPHESWMDGAPATVQALVRAALSAPQQLADFPEALPVSAPLDEAVADACGKLWLESLTVAGFRGAGPPVCLTLPPGPGLTVVAGRNGTGKSTLAEGLETLLCGQSARWQGKDRAATSGWSNLHGEGAVLRARLRRDGTPVELVRTWSGAKVSDSELAGGEGLSSPEQAKAWRPVLSCGDLLDRIRGNPSTVYDAVASVLGLDRYGDAVQVLAARRRDLERLLEAGAAERDRLVGALDGVAGEDAARAKASLQADDLAELLRVVDTTPVDPQLVRWLSAPVLTEAAPEGTHRVRALAKEHAAAVAVADRGAEAQLALLRAALALDPGPDCPLCHSPAALSQAWWAAARSTLEDGAAAGHQRAALNAELLDAVQGLRLQAEALGPWLQDSGLPWLPLPDRAETLVHHVESWWPAVCVYIAGRRRSAQQEWAHLGASWHPLVAAMRAWVEEQPARLSWASAVADLRHAEELLVDRTEALRIQRFAPIQEGALEMWSRLRRGSSVALTSVALAGRRNRRNLELEVSIDGVDGKAQGIMSQGELNALALALFLPRAMLADNPYGFVVIDDPVQAMDPGKVAGLAEVLAQVAATCQTIVLTHDERLLDALRWLAVPHRVVKVERQARSQVSVTELEAPMDQLLLDAERVLSSARLPKGIRDRSVPGLCRMALEMALRDLLAARWLRKGLAPELVAARLSQRGSLRGLLGAWWSDGAERVSDADLRAALHAVSPDAVALVEVLQAGAHGVGVNKVGRLPGQTKGLVALLLGAEGTA